MRMQVKKSKQNVGSFIIDFFTQSFTRSPLSTDYNNLIVEPADALYVTNIIRERFMLSFLRSNIITILQATVLLVHLSTTSNTLRLNTSFCSN